MSAGLQTEKTIFLEAVEIAASTERAAFLDRVCGNDRQLRAAVESLLLSHQRSQGVLDATAVPLAEHPGTQIGPYKLLQVIGEGGMGVVYMAEQTEPVKRKVALKLIKPGMDSRQVIARFEAERQALALMDHVNIARVLDAGTIGLSIDDFRFSIEKNVEDDRSSIENQKSKIENVGRPYFVMELIHGVPITKYCDDNHLTPRERLELFVPVCQAIQHAHQKGIIHRDIKPSNVMVTLYDGKPVPKVIDFGVAKATEQKLTERTLFTQYGTMIGTLEYMSPEQAEMSALGVDTRSDIYSLGVLLYELLTGSTPLSHKRMKDAAFAEILRLIKEEEPPRPSTRLSESGGALASISAQRHMEPAKLSQLMRGELDWIVMKTLEKDRNRRYETANGLAMDVQRYLHDEHVEACPPSAAYRFRKFARRNRVALVTTAVISAALIFGSLVSTWQAIRATRAERLAQTRLEAEQEARTAADVARDAANASETEAKVQEQLARQNLLKARDAVDQMLTRVAEERLTTVPQMEPVRRALLEDALKFYQGFLQQDSTEPAMRLETAQAYRRAASIQGLLGQSPEAEKSYQGAITLLQKLVTEFPADANYRVALADSYGDLGSLLIYHLSKLPEAEQAIRESLSLVGKLAAEYPDMPAYRSGIVRSHIDLAYVLKNSGRSGEAEEHLRQALAVSEKLAAEFPSQYGTTPAGVHVALGHVLGATSRPDDAERAFREALAIHEKRMAEEPNAPSHRWAVAVHQLCLGESLLHPGRHQEAEDVFRQALSHAEKMVSDSPNLPQYRAEQGAMYLGLGKALAANDRNEEAEQAYRQALAILEKILLEAPRTQTWRSRLHASQNRLAQLLKVAGRTEEAEQVCRQAVASFENLVARFPSVPQYRWDLASSHEFLGNLLLDIGRTEEAEKYYREAVRLYENLGNESPTDRHFRYGLAGCHNNLGILLQADGRAREASEEFRKMIEVWCQAAEQFPENGEVQNNAAWFLATCPDPDLRDTHRALGLAQKAVEVAPQAVHVWNTLGVAHYHAGDWSAAIEALQKSEELAPGKYFAFNAFFLAMAHWQLGDKDAARKWYDQAVEWMEKNKPQDEELKRFRVEAEELLGLKEEEKE